MIGGVNNINYISGHTDVSILGVKGLAPSRDLSGFSSFTRALGAFRGCAFPADLDRVPRIGLQCKSERTAVS